MDYCKLNAWNEKDHFPMKFMDQMLDHLIEKVGIVFHMGIQNKI